MISIDELIKMTPQRIETVFAHYLKNTQSPAQELKEAMYYSMTNGGKRVRPLLVYATGIAFQADWEALDIPACAVELIHSYSLIHDDLPAMDNADLRRGKPTCHKAYNEAIAILAGDALQPLAFEIIASYSGTLSTEQRLTMIYDLCHASGLNGMAAGQALDIHGVDTEDALIQMYALKTGALLSTSVKLGMIAANITNPVTQACLEKFAHVIGLAFQIQDDLLDIESSIETMGKPKGLDSANNKVTFPMLVGIKEAHKIVQELFENAIDALKPLDKQVDILRELANFLLQRKK